MFSWYKYLIVSLVFSHLGFWSGNLFLIGPFPDLCLPVPFVYERASLVISSYRCDALLSTICPTDESGFVGRYNLKRCDHMSQHNIGDVILTWL